MVEAALVLRVLAAVGLILTQAPPPDLGKLSILTSTGSLVRRITNARSMLPPAPVKREHAQFMSGIWDGSDYESEPPPPIFTWDSRDPAEWDYAVGHFLEVIGERDITFTCYTCAYYRYESLARRFPHRKGFVFAAQRVTAKYWKGASPENWDCGNYYYGIPTLDSRIAWLATGAPPIASIDGSLDLPPQGEGSDAPIGDDPVSLVRALSLPAPFPGFCWPPNPEVPPDPQLAHSIVPKERSFPLLCRPAVFDHQEPALPARKDMLPESDLSHMLTEFGAIAGSDELLSGKPRPFIPNIFGSGVILEL